MSVVPKKRNRIPFTMNSQFLLDIFLSRHNVELNENIRPYGKYFKTYPNWYSMMVVVARVYMSLHYEKEARKYGKTMTLKIISNWTEPSEREKNYIIK